MAATAELEAAIKLNEKALADLDPKHVKIFQYDRSKITPGIAHIGVGNFHRAHQARYMDDCLAIPGNESWGIVGISLGDRESSKAKAKAMQDQDCLYTLTEYDPKGKPSTRVIGSIIQYLHAPEDPEATMKALVDPAIRIVSMTITEGGYHLDSEGNFQADAESVQYDLKNPKHPKDTFGYLVEALARRRQAGTKPFTIFSCDNQRGNGDVAKKAVLSFAKLRDKELASWIEENVSFPNSMVDRIAPTVTDEDIKSVAERTGIEDQTPVLAETFSQWVIKDEFCNGRPPFEKLGAQFTKNVAPYEHMKGRMLNASHTAIALTGVTAGYEYVDEALDDPAIYKLVYDFMTKDVMPVIEGPDGTSLSDYRDLVLQRFSNPALKDQLVRIAGDSANKLPTFLLPTINEHTEDEDTNSRDLRRMAFILACFRRYLRGLNDKGHKFSPIEPHLSKEEIAEWGSENTEGFLNCRILASLNLADNEAFVKAFNHAVTLLKTHGVLEALTYL
ncbi:MAG: mannitol dehydrogenase family protein [Zymomonas mobilis subsp. pomaceae]|uniref:Mannitol dehydrogenase domain protein n=1 Tax=Zymomonas mobilis subsp. pomaceae (strain ATCC 29192 / DSM 22645 / JCM 10191 / CCUG 17912 / NBRC 13757 / NCIMB 11200 / NRRL B-4491 / Barker I) TaxID=579138 RepID=F8EWA1_ZYMMT|nr:mannitol dehydrogenase family protein [Zymomonas mobilis]AEI38511.1 Mannitol dehydrogenase domain protein [Zymomonas mobilis subsp. pomaceae ATCC 29192]MDX5948200.1 mannitol dehydrogenase family protein [Zymomonas mobilis subsp. pomaceae]GEB88957.1 mannitol 2-dehydrogenase [Zymomonas mobilis subsp. pomaceae]